MTPVLLRPVLDSNLSYLVTARQAEAAPRRRRLSLEVSRRRIRRKRGRKKRKPNMPIWVRTALTMTKMEGKARRENPRKKLSKLD